jgi:hypothetical protein
MEIQENDRYIDSLLYTVVLSFIIFIVTECDY